LRAFGSRHRYVRQLKRLHTPATFGFRIWKSSWLLIDYIKREGFSDGLSVMDVGCGWGLAGIYCAKQYNAVVTCVDADAKVFPFLRLHSDANQVNIVTRNMSFDDLTVDHLTNIDVLIGADICFWNEMILPLERLIHCALKADVRLILIADPGRPPFDKLERHYLDRYSARSLDRKINRPYPFQGRILKIGSLLNFSPKRREQPDLIRGT